jgi:hypothetical protein
MTRSIQTQSSGRVHKPRSIPSSRWMTAPASPSSRCPARSSTSSARTSLDLHIALGVGPETFDAMLEKAKAEGREVRGPVDHRFVRSIYFRDPNGYVIELTASTGKHGEIMDPAIARTGRRQRAIDRAAPDRGNRRPRCRRYLSRRRARATWPGFASASATRSCGATAIRESPSSAGGGASGRGEKRTDSGKTKIKASTKVKVQCRAGWRSYRA